LTRQYKQGRWAWGRLAAAGWLALSVTAAAMAEPAAAVSAAPASAATTPAAAKPAAVEASTNEAPTNNGRAAAVMKRLTGWTRADAARVAAQLQADIGRGTLEVEAQKRRILIRVLDRDAFGTGSATLRPSFEPVLNKVRTAIKELPGDISVEGHTDDIVVNSARFRSNWELSSSRAAAMAQELLRFGDFQPTRFKVVGYGNTRPLVANDTDEHRALNRRVEIVIDQGVDDSAYLTGEKPLPASLKPASAADELF